jgi:RNA polymerase sigma factor (sigma-70 family)
MPYDPAMEALTHGDLLMLAAEGDRRAWDALVERFGQMVWSVARSFRLDDATAKDVAQTVWLKLIENLGSIKDPERLPGWLATTCRREALKVAKSRDRDLLTDFEYDVVDPGPSVEEMLIDDEESRTVVTAFATLDSVCRQLLRLLTVEPALSYEEISEITGRPIGSLGPTRSRCLEKLKAAISRISQGTEGS